jgi:hypothetical protein
LIFTGFSDTSKSEKIVGVDGLFRNPVIFGLVILIIVGLQVAASYLSVTSFLNNDLLTGLSFFLLVPILGLALGFVIIWFRKPHSGS